MHGESHAASVLFGLSPMGVATTLFVATYAAIMSEKLNRAIVALLGAGLMITLGLLTQEQAIEGVDFNTLALLTGMMPSSPSRGGRAFSSISPSSPPRRRAPIQRAFCSPWASSPRYSRRCWTMSPRSS